MEKQPQNPEFRINPENFHPCKYGFNDWKKCRNDEMLHYAASFLGLHSSLRTISRTLKLCAPEPNFSDMISMCKQNSPRSDYS